ncbi:MAG: hypothetical protein KJ015_11100, partial [Myxococcales bacterium]|nr:hypothetical protein [Myxococcales bacterium]
MRWFIEVSRLGEDTPIDRYCLEAKQWQAALQEARKRRGDTGPLSKFSIELLEHGYRAVDPAQQIRYVVNKAPADASLSQPPPPQPGGTAPGSFPAPPKVPSAPSPSPVIKTVPEPVPSTDPMASPPPHSDPLAAGPKTDPMAALPPESHPPRTDPLPQPKPAPIPVPADPVPPIGAGSPSSTTQPMTPPGRPEPPPGQMTQRSMEAAREPDFQVVKKREEEPTEKSPIIYREYAYAVKPGTERASTEVLLWLRFRELSSALQSRSERKFIQLAVFDHVFEKKPARPPLATLMWKDWRGEPVVQFMGATPAAAPAPAAQSAPPPAVPRPTPSAPPPPVVAQPFAPAPSSPVSAPPPAPATAPLPAAPTAAAPAP